MIKTVTLTRIQNGWYVNVDGGRRELVFQACSVSDPGLVMAFNCAVGDLRRLMLDDEADVGARALTPEQLEIERLRGALDAIDRELHAFEHTENADRIRRARKLAEQAFFFNESKPAVPPQAFVPG